MIRPNILNPIPKIIVINPNCLKVDKAIIFFKSHSYNALMPDIIIVKMEINNNTKCNLPATIKTNNQINPQLK